MDDDVVVVVVALTLVTHLRKDQVLQTHDPFVRLETFIHALFPMQKDSCELTLQQRWPVVPVLQHPFFLVEPVHPVGGFVVSTPVERNIYSLKTQHQTSCCSSSTMVGSVEYSLFGNV